MTRLVRALITALVGVLLGVPAMATAAVGEPLAQTPIYTYDAPHWSGSSTHTTTERGPPASTYDHTERRSAVDATSHGRLVRPHPEPNLSYTTYDHSVQLARGDSVRVATRTASAGREADLRVLSGVRCAAKSADELLPGVKAVGRPVCPTTARGPSEPPRRVRRLWSRSARRASTWLLGALRGPAFGVVDEQVVDVDVEDLGHTDDGFEFGLSCGEGARPPSRGSVSTESA